MKEKLQNLKKILDDSRLELEKYFKDPIISLDERWETLELAKDLNMGGCSWRTDFDLKRDDEFLYEGPLYMQKCETRDVFSILESLKEDKSFNLTLGDEVTFKLYCLNNFYTSMTFDW